MAEEGVLSRCDYSLSPSALTFHPTFWHVSRKGAQLSMNTFSVLCSTSNVNRLTSSPQHIADALPGSLVRGAPRSSRAAALRRCLQCACS